MQKLTHRERLLAERKMKEWRKSNGDLPEPEVLRICQCGSFFVKGINKCLTQTPQTPGPTQGSGNGHICQSCPKLKVFLNM